MSWSAFKSWAAETSLWSLGAGAILIIGFLSINGCSAMTEAEHKRATEELADMQALARLAIAEVEHEYGDLIQDQLNRVEELAERHAEQLQREQQFLGVFEVIAGFSGIAGAGGITTAVRRVHAQQAAAAHDRVIARAEGEEVGKVFGYQNMAAAIAEVRASDPSFNAWFDGPNGDSLAQIMDALDAQMRPSIISIKDGGAGNVRDAGS